MRKFRRVTAAFLMAVWMLPSMTFAEGLSVNPIPCVAPAMNAPVTAVVPPNLISPRIFFKATGPGPEYYVDMHRGPNGTWWGVLPEINHSTLSITYRVGAADGTNTFFKSSPITLRASAACPSTVLTREEQVAADHLVIGMTAYDQPAIPPGFACTGITNIIAANGQMRPAEQCLATRRASRGLGTPPEVAGAAAFAAAALVVGYAAGRNNDHNRQVSPSH